MNFILVDPTYQLLWERFITIVAKAKTAWAVVGIVTTSSSEGTLDSINYGVLGLQLLLDIPHLSRFSHFHSFLSKFEVPKHSFKS